MANAARPFPTIAILKKSFSPLPLIANGLVEKYPLCDTRKAQLQGYRRRLV
jgi:hypothetical protein